MISVEGELGPRTIDLIDSDHSMNQEDGKPEKNVINTELQVQYGKL